MGGANPEIVAMEEDHSGEGQAAERGRPSQANLLGSAHLKRISSRLGGGPSVVINDGVAALSESRNHSNTGAQFDKSLKTQPSARENNSVAEGA